MHARLPPLDAFHIHQQSQIETMPEVDLDLDWRTFATNNTAEYFQTSEEYYSRPELHTANDYLLSTIGQSYHQSQLPVNAYGRPFNSSHDGPYAFGLSSPTCTRDLDPGWGSLGPKSLYSQQILGLNGPDFYRLNSPNESILSSISGSGNQSPYSAFQPDALHASGHGGSTCSDPASSDLSRSPTLSLPFVSGSPHVYIQHESDQENPIWLKDTGIDPGKIQPQQDYERAASVPILPDVQSRHGSCTRDMTVELTSMDVATDDIMQDDRNSHSATLESNMPLKDVEMTEDGDASDQDIEEARMQTQKSASEDDSDYSPNRSNARLKPKQSRRQRHSTNNNNATTKSPKFNSPTKITKRVGNNHRQSKTHSRNLSNASSSTNQSPTTPKSTGTRTTQKRPFTCPLTPYGCTSDFATKNEWKRHTTSQHLRLGFWRCDLCPDRETRPNDFNRKDLFTQHLRRMHLRGKKGEKSVLDGVNENENEGVDVEMGRRSSSSEPKSPSKAGTHPQTPTSPTSPTSSSLSSTALDAALVTTRTRCWTSLRTAPSQLRCAICNACFSSKPVSKSKSNPKTKTAVQLAATESCVDEWLEHVGRHLASADAGKRGSKAGVVNDDVVDEGEDGNAEGHAADTVASGGAVVDWEKDEHLRRWMVGEGLLVPAKADAGYVLAERGCGH